MPDHDGTEVIDRPAGWFVTSGGKPLPGALSQPNGSLLWRIGTKVVGFGAILCGLYFALGPWSVTTTNGAAYCGLPIMGRYDHSTAPDLAATTFTACWNQAQDRKTVAALLVIVGILVLVATYFIGRRRAGHRGLAGASTS